MTITIAFANMKGGVGKTTLCVNLAFELFFEYRNILVVDNDPQFNATTALVKPSRYISTCIKTDSVRTVYNIYEKPPRIKGARAPKMNPKDFFIGTWHFDDDHSLDLIPSRIELYETLRNPSQKEYLLDKFLRANAAKYDYIFIDCPPTPSVLTLSAFAASDFVLIPVTPDYFASVGLPQFLATLDDFKTDLHDDHGVQPLGVIFSNVQRQPGITERKAIRQVSDTLNELNPSIHVFQSRLSHLRVFEKTLWQSRPVRQIRGRGTRGKTEAGRELVLQRRIVMGQGAHTTSICRG